MSITKKAFESSFSYYLLAFFITLKPLSEVNELKVPSSNSYYFDESYGLSSVNRGELMELSGWLIL